MGGFIPHNLTGDTMLDIISDTMFIVCAPLAVFFFVKILKTLDRILVIDEARFYNNDEDY